MLTSSLTNLRFHSNEHNQSNASLANYLWEKRWNVDKNVFPHNDPTRKQCLKILSAFYSDYNEPFGHSS